MAVGGAGNTPPNGPPPSDIQSSPNFIAFDPKNVVPSQPIPLQRNDQLSLLILTNAPALNLQLNYRWLTPEGEIKEGQFNAPNGPGPAVFNITLYEGWLLSLTPKIAGGQIPGMWMFVQISLARNLPSASSGVVSGLVWQGYVNAVGNNGWPGQAAKEITDGPGVLRTVAVGTPAPGAEFSDVTPLNTRRILLSLLGLFVTSAAVANRLPRFQIFDNLGATVFEIGTNTAQVASTSNVYQAAPGNQFYNDTQGDIVLPFPNVTPLKTGFTIKSLTNAIQAADQWSNIRYVVFEWGMWDT